MSRQNKPKNQPWNSRATIQTAPYHEPPNMSFWGYLSNFVHTPISGLCFQGYHSHSNPQLDFTLMSSLSSPNYSHFFWNLIITSSFCYFHTCWYFKRKSDKMLKRSIHFLFPFFSYGWSCSESAWAFKGSDKLLRRLLKPIYVYIYTHIQKKQICL